MDSISGSKVRQGEVNKVTGGLERNILQLHQVDQYLSRLDLRTIQMMRKQKPHQKLALHLRSSIGIIFTRHVEQCLA
jgi:hypothetical protein